MISPRRAALQGLTVPLTAIMVAVLGLWPEEEDEELPPAPPTLGGGGGGKIPAPRSLRLVRWREEQTRIQRQNLAAITTILAAIAEGILA